jgi:hypothetical protein
VIKKVWEADPLGRPKCSRKMRIVSLTDEEDVIDPSSAMATLWQEGVRDHSGTGRPSTVMATLCPQNQSCRAICRAMP